MYVATTRARLEAREAGFLVLHIFDTYMKDFYNPPLILLFPLCNG